MCYRYTNPLFGTALLYAKNFKCQVYISHSAIKYYRERKRPFPVNTLTFFDYDFLDLQAGVAAAGEIDGPVAAEHQQAAPTVIFQQLRVTAQI